MVATTYILSKPPPPLDDPSVSNPLDCPPLQYGMIGCGRVSHDFVQALKHLPTQRVVACATQNDLERAQVFATKHNIPQAYGTYDALLQDPNVQLVYVGNIHIFRRDIVEQCILANKHVLVEKPFACNATDAEYLITLAQGRKLFVMEGMWTRFFPVVEQARRLLHGTSPDEPNHVLGEIVTVNSDFNIQASDHEEYPTSFMYQRKLGGGATLLTGPYPIAAALLCFPNLEPSQIKAVGQLDDHTEVDLQVSVVLNFPSTSDVAPAMDESRTDGERTPKLPGAGTATLSYGLLCESEEMTAMIGTKGRLTILNPSHNPTRLKLEPKAHGRGNAEDTIVYEYPLPRDTPDIIAAGGFVYPNSAGFCYEAAAVARCIASGKLEAPQYPLSETLRVLRIMDEIRSQLHMKSVFDA